MDDHRVAAGRAGEEQLGVDGPGLGLQGEEEVVVVVDDAAAGRERVGAEPLLEEVEDLALAGEGAVGDLAEARRAWTAGRLGEQVGVEGVVHPQPVVGPVAAGVELAEVHRGQVRGHRLGRVPQPGPLGAVALAAQQAAVGDHLQAGRGGDHEGVGRLVDRVVVDREPARGHLGLAGDDGAVVGVDEAGLDGEAGAEHDLLGDGDAVVADHDGELLALAQPVLRGDGELVVGPRPGRRPAVHLDRADGQPDEVEVEADRFWVARAEIVATPTSRSVAGS